MRTGEEKIIVDGQEITLYDHDNWIAKLKEEYPHGVKINIPNMEIYKLHNLISHVGERYMYGKTMQPTETITSSDEYFNVEMELMPKDYDIINASYDYYNYEIEDAADVSPNEVEITNFMNNHDKISEGEIELYVTYDEKLFLNNLYVEGVKMGVALPILANTPDSDMKELKNKLQLVRLMQQGIKVLEDNAILGDKARGVVERVYDKYQHMYTGKRKLESHEYYETDIKPKFDRELMEEAELELRKMNVIKTYPQSLLVRWTDNQNNNWECKEMTKYINNLFKGYKEKVVQATEVQKPWMKVDIFTTNPEYQKRIFDMINHSWAMMEQREITEPEEMAEEIRKVYETIWEDANSMLMTFPLDGGENMYVMEEGTVGLKVINRNRAMVEFGQDFRFPNIEKIYKLLEEGNVLRNNQCFLNLIGEKRTLLDLENGNLIHVSMEEIEDKIMPVQLYKGNIYPYEKNKEHLLDITDMITNVYIYPISNNNHAIRCKINGEKQMGKPLKRDDFNKLVNGSITELKLVAEYFMNELASLKQGKNQDKSLKR